VNADLWVMDADGRNAKQLTTHPAVDTVANWTPDGKALVFRSDRGGKPALWRKDLASGEEKMLVQPAQDLDWPRLSPDGRRVAFNSRSGGGAINVWLLPLDGGAAQQLTFDSQSLGFPVWAPDGKTLALEMKRGDASHIALQSVTGGPARPVTNDTGQSWPYSYSPDGKHIAFAGLRKGYWNVYRVEVSSGEVQRLTNYERLSAYVRYTAWSPRGDTILYEQALTQGNVWQLEGLPE
jgi:TolB protein